MMSNNEAHWRNDFLSWKCFKTFIEKALQDQCARDVLRTYVPENNSEDLKFDGSLGLHKAPVTFLGSESDFLKIAGITIPFVVKSGQIYFDLFPSFLLLGQLPVALKSEWQEIDAYLQQVGFNLKLAFRITSTSTASYKTWRSLRSAVSYEALKALAKSHIVPAGPRKDRVLAIFKHLDTDLMGFEQAKDDLFVHLQKIVDDHIEKKPPGQIQAPPSGILAQNLEQEMFSGTVICYRGCGRYYHYAIKCCKEIHKIRFMSNLVNYIVYGGQVFFDKCTAFSILGKIQVVSNSDYRFVDKILESKSMDLDLAFLSEKSQSDWRKRTHVSFEALQVLVQEKFVQKELKEDAEKFVGKVGQSLIYYKSKCHRYEGKDRILVASHTQESDEDDEESSSGIESGDASSSSGKASPVQQDDHEHDHDEFTVKILDNSLELHLSLDNNHLYCAVSDFMPFLKYEYDHLVAILKRTYRSVDVDQSFRSRIFKAKTKTIFFSVKCFKLLLEKSYLKKFDRNYDKGKILFELERLVDKFTKAESDVDEADCMSDGDLEECETKPTVVNEENVLVKIADAFIPYHVKDKNIFVERRLLQTKFFNVSTLHNRNHLKMDQLLDQAGFNLDKTFIWYGKNRKFISIPALKCLLKAGFYTLKNPDLKATLEESLEKLNREKSTLMARKVLHLPSFESIPYKLSRGTMYLSTIAFLKAVGASKKYLKDKPTKSYFTVLRLLKKQGMDIKGCFLKQGICKYGHISVRAALTLFKSESGPFRNKKRIKALSNELQRALRKFPGLNFEPEACASQPDADQKAWDSNVDVVSDTITIGDVKVRYQIKHGSIYFHRSTIFDAIGLEKAMLLNFRGMSAVSKILTSHKIDLAKAYLKSTDEQYGYISFTGLWTILDAEDPLVTLLERRSTFSADLLSLVQAALRKSSRNKDKEVQLFEAIPMKIQAGKLMLHKTKTVAFSGLYDRAPLLASYADFIGLEPLMKFIRLESDQRRSTGYSNLIWTDMISAILHETPKLRNHVKLVDFRDKVLSFLESELVSYLSRPDSYRSDNQPILTPQEIKLDPAAVASGSSSTSSENDESEPDQIEEIFRSHESMLDVAKEEVVIDFQADKRFSEENATFALSQEEFGKIEESVEAIRSGIIGDWHVKKCDSTEIRLIVNPGYGASKKISFVQPDVSAILKYELSLRPKKVPALFINDLEVPYELIDHIFKRELNHGLFGLLYNLLTLRPCFGNFQPELVETLEKRSRLKDQPGKGYPSASHMVIDTNFIGSSQNGRTYAGSVRSKECSVLATSKVSDMCHFCSSLQCSVVINRSVLASPIKNRSMSQESNSSTTSSNGSYQQSVWKVEESSLEGCTFLCPQLQSYNTSLPHQFMSASQASSVVEHRVNIGQDLSLKVSLNQKPIVGKKFAEFEKTKQVGPLLDAVASMRMCVGYPDPLLVTEAKYMMQNKIALPNEIKKFFNYIDIDQDFSGKMNCSSVELKGTMRATSCRFVASDHADICDQCRLLQEPLNFLGL